MNTTPKLKVGDTVKMSHKNTNHLGNDVCAYAGMEGLVTDVYADRSFCLNCGSSILVVPANNAHKSPRQGVWLYLNGVHVFHAFHHAEPPHLNKLYHCITNLFK